MVSEETHASEDTSQCFLFMSHRFEVGLAAVVSCGYVSDMDNPDAPACLRVRTLTIKVPDPAKDLLDGGWVLTDDVGGLRHMISVPGDRKPQQRRLSK